jgi:NAD-dependent SIR2 family protein deacetylase
VKEKMNNTATLKTAAKSPPTPSFRQPGTTKWESLNMSSGAKDAKEAAKRANEILKNMLLQSLQMQHLVVLAGAGCSLHAGGPSMKDIWNAIVGRSVSAEAKRVAKSINYHLSTKRNIETFLSQVEIALTLKEDKDTRKFFEEAKKIIRDKCSDFLKKDKLTTHEIFLRRLMRRRTRDQRLRLFTTNYDLCFERAAANINCVSIDGFSFMTPRQYDPCHFDFDIVRRPRFGENNDNYLEGVFYLYKLHGSVNWERTEIGIVEKEQPDPKNACLIYPVRGKYQQSFNQPFIESISKYLTAMREANTCFLVVGFGFNDDHLSEPLLSAVHSNPHLRLIIVDSNSRKNAGKGKNCPSRHLRKFVELSERGDDVWVINETFSDFTNRIPDLKSLTPAERLFENIKEITKNDE